VIGSSGTAARAQDIHIKVVDGRNGKVMTTECVNVWIGKTTIHSLLIPTDKDGVASLHLTNDATVTNIQQSGSACGGEGLVGPVVKCADIIRITGSNYIHARPTRQIHLGVVLGEGSSAVWCCHRERVRKDRGVPKARGIGLFCQDAEQLKEDVEWRKEVAENAGLGFKLPTVESSVGLLGLPKQQRTKLKEVA
jgi:hypothetical protein